MANNIDLECSVLSSFLFSAYSENHKEDTFELNQNAFTTKFHKAVARKINEETLGDKAYDFLLVSLEDDVLGTQFEDEWVNILAQSPMALTVSKRIHTKLINAYNKRMKDRL